MSSARVRNCPTMTMTTRPGEDADGDPIPTPRTRQRNGSTGSRSWPRSAFCQILMLQACLRPSQLLPDRRKFHPSPHVSMAAARCTTAVSKAGINVRVGVQHKCHFVKPPLYQMMTQ